jgi:hypothetical protein
VTDLTDLDSVKAWLQLTTNGSDQLLTQLISAASTFVRSYLNRDLSLQDYVEVYDGNAGNKMMVRNGPITAVASVAFAGQTITAAADPVMQTSGILFSGRQITLIGYRFVYGAPVQVSYSAGFTTIPADLKQAVTELVGERFKVKDRIGQNSKSMGGQASEVISFSTADMNAFVKTTLAQYRAVAPV